MTDLEAVVTRLAVLTAMEQRIAAAKAITKTELTAGLTRGTVYAFDKLGDDDDAHQLGRATVPKPTQPKPVIAIVDEARAFAWMVDEFGDDTIETVVRPTVQGRKSLDAAILAAHKSAGSPATFEHEGITVTVPPARPGSPSFTPSKTVGAQVEAMVQAGRLSVADVLNLPAVAAPTN